MERDEFLMEGFSVGPLVAGGPCLYLKAQLGVAPLWGARVRMGLQGKGCEERTVQSKDGKHLPTRSQQLGKLKTPGKEGQVQCVCVCVCVCVRMHLHVYACMCVQKHALVWTLGQGRNSHSSCSHFPNTPCALDGATCTRGLSLSLPPASTLSPTRLTRPAPDCPGPCLESTLVLECAK
ncbi:hypothetical protein HJG60_010367 [Phyllostomus discolor]|uniref:Uncharacterized protein n=1 Tax=Phyllostomus discolor TaxID=89673 RepID=A0A834EJY9_9CHIR|nr:hypothetical protein HJG60_010367 [Phyllostomus discolor]